MAGDLLDLLFVDPDHSGQGIAGAMLDHAEAAARAEGHPRLNSFASHMARPLLLRRGWQDLGPNRVQRRGQWLENTRMTLSLA